MTALYIISFLGLFLVVYLVRCKRQSNPFERKGRAIFEEVYKGASVIPKYECCLMYGFPSFTITFTTRSALKAANERGANEPFSRQIEQLCKDSGSKSNPFDVDRAVWFTSEEELAAIRAKARHG